MCDCVCCLLELIDTFCIVSAEMTNANYDHESHMILEFLKDSFNSDEVYVTYILILQN